MPDQTLEGQEAMRLARALGVVLLAVGELLDATTAKAIVTAQLASAAQALSDRLVALR